MPGSNLTRIEAEERKAVIEAPIHYHVDLDLTVGAKNFGSKSLICFNAKPGSSTFLDLIADEVTSIDLNGKSLDPAVAFQDNRIELTDLKEKNEVTVEAKCRYSNTGEGLHRSVDPSDGNIYLYSQFEVPDARRVYAVFDQPDLKATFDFKVLAPASWIVTSNMPVATIEDDPRETLDGTLGDKPNESTRLWDFEPTPVMSSYLTAICAGPYAEWHTEYLNEDGRTVPMAQYCRQSLAKAFAKDVDYLFDITKKGFAFYAKTWGVPYPYAKFDQIYVPEYNAGAMENIGMVTIRDSYVFESKVTDALAERRVGALFLVKGKILPGGFDINTGTVTFDGDPNPVDDGYIDPAAPDITDAFAQAALAQDAHIYIVEQNQMPTDKSVAALFRYAE